VRRPPTLDTLSLGRCVNVGPRVFIAGHYKTGENGRITQTANLACWNTATSDNYVHIAPPIAVGACSTGFMAAELNGKVYVSGAQLMDCYDPATHAWTRCPDMPNTMWGHVSV